MKTNLVKIIVGSTLALTIAAALVLSAQAADQVKGAQLLLQPSQTTVAVENVAAPAMNCGACKSVLTENTRIEKGHIKTVSIGEKHLCSTCSTTISTVGVGKAAKNVANHTCAASGASCGMKAGS